MNSSGKSRVKRLLPCHCTDFASVAYLWNEFPDKCETCPVGTILKVGGLDDGKETLD